MQQHCAAAGTAPEHDPHRFLDHRLAVTPAGVLRDTYLGAGFDYGPLRIYGGHLLGQGLWVALACGLPLSLAFPHSEPLLLALGQPPAVAAEAAVYLGALSWSVLPFLGFVALRGFLYALGETRPVMVITLAANLVNALANYALLEGRLGCPALGVAGLGYATALARFFMLLPLAAWVARPRYARHRPRWGAPDPAALRRLLALGAPVGLLTVLEAGGFGAAGMVVGWLGEVPLAAHQVVLTIASTTFMVPLGLSIASAVLVGQEVGRGRPADALRLGATALAMGAGFMATSAALLLAFPLALAGAFTRDPAVLAVAVTLLPVAGAFQVFDGLQVVAAGCLRGAGETRTPLAANVLGFWCLGLPGGGYLAHRAGWGAAGVWWGLAAALLVTGLVLSASFLRGRWGGGPSSVRVEEERDLPSPPGGPP